MPIIGGYNPNVSRRSASQQVLALQGSLPAVPQPDVNLLTNPLFGRPSSTNYAPRVSTPQQGPLPKLSLGSGQTGQAADRSQAGFVPPGHLAVVEDYEPVGLDNEPLGIDTFTRPNMPPKSINAGTNGRELVGTYDPHDFTPAQRFIQQWRSAKLWMSPVFGPSWRNLLVWQQVAKYNLYNATAQSRPVSAQDYFAGYVTSQNVPIQGSGMGISGGTLGYR
jgi:hypothetical protein